MKRHETESSTDSAIAPGEMAQGSEGGTIPAVKIEGLTKTYPGASSPAVAGFDLTVAPGEVVALLGPSGCGKTTTLRCVAGLEVPDGGSVTIGGRSVNSGARVVRPEERDVSMVFQQYALWPHLTVWENVAFGLRARRRPSEEIDQLTADALATVRLMHLKDRRIAQLSGGQQQRIALARAIAVRPKLVLFDEPLSNLDAKLREEMRFELLALQQEIGFAALYVTHDQIEALSLADRVIVMNEGRVEQSGTPLDVWGEPASPFVVDFTGQQNKLEVEIVAVQSPDLLEVATVDGVRLTVRAGSYRNFRPGDRALAYIQLTSVRLAESTADQVNRLDGRVSLRSFEGHSVVLRVDVGTQTQLMARLEPLSPLQVEDKAQLQIDPEHFHVFPVDDER